MDSELLKKMDMQVKIFMKFRNYVNLLERDIKKNGYEYLNERDYRRNVCEFAVQKSNFVALFSDKEKLNQWLSNTSEQNKNFMYDLAKNNNFEITSKDQVMLMKKDNNIFSSTVTKYELSPAYTKEKALFLTQFIKESCALEGENYLNIQKEAKEVLTESFKTLSIRTKVIDLSSQKFGKNYDDVLSDFRTAIYNGEVDKIGKDLVINSKSLGLPQKIKFSVNENNQISEMGIVPPCIKLLNDKFRASEEVHSKMKIS